MAAKRRLRSSKRRLRPTKRGLRISSYSPPTTLLVVLPADESMWERACRKAFAEREHELGPDGPGWIEMDREYYWYWYLYCWLSSCAYGGGSAGVATIPASFLLYRRKAHLKKKVAPLPTDSRLKPLVEKQNARDLGSAPSPTSAAVALRARDLDEIDSFSIDARDLDEIAFSH